MGLGVMVDNKEQDKRAKGVVGSKTDSLKAPCAIEYSNSRTVRKLYA